MLKYVLKRLLQTVVLLLAVTVVVFWAMNLAPGNPAEIMLGQDATPENVAKLMKEMGLDLPLHVQYVRFLQNLLKGDLGNSFRTRRPVVEEIGRAFPVSVQVAAISVAVSAVIGVTIGVISAVRQYSVLDSTVRLGVLAGVSIPTFWLGLLLIYLFSVYLRILPSSGWGSWRQAVLPCLTLATFPLALFVRLTRSSMLEVIRQDHVRTARAKGLPGGTVVRRHALRNGLVPVVTVVGLQFASLIGGSVMTETVFAIPGLGRTLVMAVYSRDYPVIRGCTILAASVFAVVNLVVDVLYTFLDPRIRYE
ncbi:MAG: ABC transporter permease [Firmicutes bacterium]|nr:ABC transporter permease [Bacillota bacterium]